MNNENQKLLEEVIQDRLNKALSESGEYPEALEDAIKAIDRQLKIDDKKLEIEKEQMKHNFEVSKNAEQYKHEIERERIKHKYELDREEQKQEHEINRDDNHFDHEVTKEKMKHRFDIELETEKQNFIRVENAKDRTLEEEKIKADKIDKIQNRAVKLIEIGALCVAVPLIDGYFKTNFAKMLCEFEKEYTFTTTAGRSLSSLFKFK